ncbi:MAG: 2-phosphosulfolactate phosphatase [Chloroflexi bacterium]|nr:2-phosphosulfolactate phosphatase [Chloroflexota bacterium]
MKFHYTNLETCHEATGPVIVIDVIRAFTNAAFAFGQGAERILPVSSVDEALALKRQLPNALACGEVGGLPPEGFDFGNSPTQTQLLDLRGRTILQRTSAGTQGVTRSVRAEQMLAASFVVAGATICHVRQLAPETVSFVITGQTFSTGGEEDLACAEYLEACLRGQSTDAAPYLERVRRSRDAQQHFIPNQTLFPASDIDLCTELDRFDFAMPIAREDGRFVMRAIRP